MRTHLSTSTGTLCSVKSDRVSVTRSAACVTCPSCLSRLRGAGVRTSGSARKQGRPKGTPPSVPGGLDPRVLATFLAAGVDFRGTWKRGVESGPGDVWAEVVFSDRRKFRLDFALPAERIAIEIHGGKRVVRQSGNVGGAHHSPVGRKRDMEKARLANAEGWCYGEFDYQDINDGSLLEWLVEVREKKRPGLIMGPGRFPP